MEPYTVLNRITSLAVTAGAAWLMQVSAIWWLLLIGWAAFAPARLSPWPAILIMSGWFGLVAADTFAMAGLPVVILLIVGVCLWAGAGKPYPVDRDK